MLNSISKIIFSIFHLNKLLTIFDFPEDSILINDVIFIEVWLIQYFKKYFLHCI